MSEGERGNQWHTIRDFTLAEEVTEVVVGEDEDGVKIESYNPSILGVTFSVRVDATQPTDSGSPWIFPHTSNNDSLIRVIGNISSWKKIKRTCVEMFIGNEKSIVGVGNAQAQLDPASSGNIKMNGIRIFLHSGHFPVGTRIIVVAFGVKP